MDVHLTKMQEVHDAIRLTWTNISENGFQQLVESMPQRNKADVNAKGFISKVCPTKQLLTISTVHRDLDYI